MTPPTYRQDRELQGVLPTCAVCGQRLFGFAGIHQCGGAVPVSNLSPSARRKPLAVTIEWEHPIQFVVDVGLAALIADYCDPSKPRTTQRYKLFMKAFALMLEWNYPVVPDDATCTSPATESIP